LKSDGPVALAAAIGGNFLHARSVLEIIAPIARRHRRLIQEDLVPK
jgi:hypothetical protein